MARFVTVSRWVREDRTIRPDAFVPPPDLRLSVTRHDALSVEGLWSIGRAVVAQVARTRKAELSGRADRCVRDVLRFGLATEAAPVPGNPYHAEIVGWPAEKAAQKNIAQQLAAIAAFRPWTSS
ncbi:hypothetical protein [Methylacidimicrobium cyclopophantes]|uniref:hypothetical protein n=1 Tax=Methylacidimicrobium cyclopophantes TaxID=1041766 RepID=UPI00115949A8|nr:hypothetical protein [Methylacidimicrobium cyclopophantes]